MVRVDTEESWYSRMVGLNITTRLFSVASEAITPGTDDIGMAVLLPA